MSRIDRKIVEALHWYVFYLTDSFPMHPFSTPMLTATIKLFFKRPPECQELIGRLLRHCIGMYFI